MVVLHNQREDEAVQVVLHRLGDILEQAISNSHVLIVPNVEEVERPNLVSP